MALGENVIPKYIEDEMKESYITYAMSVIVSRALPDVRDGLKPVHRRILYTMEEISNYYNRPYKKSARIVGDVMGKYHPHGDMAIYNTLVRMAQSFSMRNTLIDGQGNFGSIDGDNPAAMRYTEVRMAALSSELLRDINKNTVDFQNNYDDTMQEPVVLPAAFPNLLVNGSSGIAVGMATNIPSHNLGEIIDATCAVIDEPEITIDELYKIVPGPDFPTAGIIYGTNGIMKAYKKGRGSIAIRSKIDVEETKRGKTLLIVKEIPYQVKKTTIIEKIAELIREKKLDGISDIRDESDREGIRIVMELKKTANVKVLINQLFIHTPLQVAFGIILLALVNNEPKVLNLKEAIQHYIAHRKEVQIRRAKFELTKAEKRAHILEGYLKALDNLDEIIQLIKSSENVDAARKGLMTRFEFSKEQAQAILEMRLQQLTALERDKIQKEYDELVKLIDYLKRFLDSDEMQYNEMKKDLIEIKEKYADERKTVIEEDTEEIVTEDLIPEEDNVITISNEGYIKRIHVNTYRRQRRGGIGVSGSGMRNEDFIQHLFVASTHDYLMFISDKGKAYHVKVYEIPEGSRTAKGRSVRLLLQLDENERIMTCLPVKGYDDDELLVMITRKGIIKKTKLSEYVNARSRGVKGINLDDDDSLVEAILTHGEDEIFICTKNGRALRVDEKEVRTIGRSARGVKGINIKGDDEAIGISRVTDEYKLLVVTRNGFGKLMKFSELSPHHRGTGGQIYIKTSEKTGEVIKVYSVHDEDEVMFITANGMVVKLEVKSISTFGKTARGVKLVQVKGSDYIVDVARVVAENGNDKDTEMSLFDKDNKEN